MQYAARSCRPHQARMMTPVRTGRRKEPRSCGRTAPDDERKHLTQRLHVKNQSSDRVTDDCPFTAGDRHDFPWLVDQRVPGVATVIDDIVKLFKDAI
jgi:hypothetical protein